MDRGELPDTLSGGLVEGAKGPRPFRPSPLHPSFVLLPPQRAPVPSSWLMGLGFTVG